jgi:hypothetical protein
MLPQVCDLIKSLLRRPDNQPRNALLMGPWRDVSKSHAARPKDLGSALEVLCNRAGMEWAIELYSMRHRFQSDMLELGVSEHHLRYLMGHETAGFESRSIYTDHSLRGFKEAYGIAARELARRYGLAT